LKIIRTEGKFPMTIEEIMEKLKNSLPAKRYVHSLNVMETACALAKRYNQDLEKAALAGLLHDCARRYQSHELPGLCQKYGIAVDNISCLHPLLLHGPVGSFVAREEYQVTDEEVLSAIYCHTTGKENMSRLEKIVFIADFIEPGRDFDEVEGVRDIAFEDLDKALLKALDCVIFYVIKKGHLIHQDSIKARNYLLMKST